jgi:hypothetical protein
LKLRRKVGGSIEVDEAEALLERRLKRRGKYRKEV